MSLGADEHSAANARVAIREAKEVVKEEADHLFNSKAYGRTLEERHAIGRRLNAAVVKMTTAQHWLGVYD
jgi:maleate cis-trans isomerase